MRVQDVMSTKVKTIAASDPADLAWERMKADRIHHLVVVDGRNQVAGVISERDLGGRDGAEVRKNHLVEELMTANAATASPEMTLRDAANLLRGRSIGCLPVTRQHHVLGIITVTDLLDLVGRGGLAAPGSTGKTRWKRIHRVTRYPHLTGALH